MTVVTSGESQSSGTARRINLLVILRAAEEVFARHGLGGTSLQMIAEVAGLPKSNISYYFKTKEGLYSVILEKAVAASLSDAAAWITADRAPEAALTGYIAARLSWARVHSDAARILAIELSSGASVSRGLLTRGLTEHTEAVANVFAVWKTRGSLVPVSVPHFLFCAWSMSLGYVAFTPQVEVLLGRQPGTLTDQDFDVAAKTITGFVLSACSRNVSSGLLDRELYTSDHKA